jgi:hypothetical protein
MDEAENNIGYWQGLALPVSNVILGFIHVQLYSLMMDARHPKQAGGWTTVCSLF